MNLFPNDFEFHQTIANVTVYKTRTSKWEGTQKNTDY